MTFYLYEIVNLINGKKYIGVHQTSNLNDNYMGSGTLIKKAIKKYGIKNFKKNILAFFSSADEMYKKEKEIVNEGFLQEINNYNLCQGGKGGFNYINSSGIPKFRGKRHTQETKERLSKAATNRIVTDQTRQILTDNHWSKKNPEKFLKHVVRISTGRKKSIEEKEKIAKKISLLHEHGNYSYDHVFGNKNNKGKRWIHKGNLQKMIDKDCLLPLGWSEKRK